MKRLILLVDRPLLKSTQSQASALTGFAKASYTGKQQAAGVVLLLTSPLRSSLVTGLTIMPEEFDTIIKRLPRDSEDVDLFKKIVGTGPLPDR